MTQLKLSSFKNRLDNLANLRKLLVTKNSSKRQKNNSKPLFPKILITTRTQTKHKSKPFLNTPVRPSGKISKENFLSSVYKTPLLITPKTSICSIP